MSGSRTVRMAATGARVLLGAAVAGACVLGVIAGAAAPWPGVEYEPAAVRVTPAPSAETAICNGSFRALGRDTTRADLMVAGSDPSLIADGQAGEPESAELDMPDLAGGSGAQRLTGTIEGRSATRIAAVETSTLSTDDLAGLAAAPCRAPSLQTWLVGGDASTGAADVIVLSNATDVPSTVALVVYGASQQRSSSTVVPPMTQIGIPLASIAPGEGEPVVQVTAEGAPVRAVLQSSEMSVLDPVGIDLQDGIADARTSLMFTGVQSDEATGDAGGVVLRLLAPDAGTVATVTMRRTGSTGAAEEFTVELAEGVPTEVALAGGARGFSDIAVRADEPVVGAVRQSVVVGQTVDFAWMTPAPEISGEVMFAVPDAASPRLHVANPSDAPAEVTLLVDGAEERLTVPASGSTTVPLRGGTTPVLRTDAAVQASVTVSESGAAGIAGWPLWPVQGIADAVTVYQ